jgi:hypothetical protein
VPKFSITPKPEFESAPALALRRTKEAIAPVRYVVAGGVALPLVTGILTKWFTGSFMNGLQAAVIALASVLAAVVGLYLMHLFRAPYDQRNELRDEIKGMWDRLEEQYSERTRRLSEWHRREVDKAKDQADRAQTMIFSTEMDMRDKELKFMSEQIKWRNALADCKQELDELNAKGLNHEP